MDRELNSAQNVLFVYFIFLLSFLQKSRFLSMTHRKNGFLDLPLLYLGRMMSYQAEIYCGSRRHIKECEGGKKFDFGLWELELQKKRLKNSIVQ